MNYVEQEMILMNKKKIQEKLNYQNNKVEELKSNLNEEKEVIDK